MSAAIRGFRSSVWPRPGLSTASDDLAPVQAMGLPGYIRVDTVHQGDLDGVKGLYHSNAVDEVTQFEVVGAVEKLSERYLKPGSTLETLDAIAMKSTGNEAANGLRKLNNNSLKPLLNRTIRRHSGNPYSHYQNSEFSIIGLLEYTPLCLPGIEPCQTHQVVAQNRRPDISLEAIKPFPVCLRCTKGSF